MKHLHLNVGDVITITNSDYGISSGSFRIVNKDITDIDSNEVKFTATQFLEALFEDTYLPASDPQWTNPSTYADEAQYVEFFEMPLV